MTSQSEKKTTTVHILSSISRSKGIQPKKFGQLIEHLMILNLRCRQLVFTWFLIEFKNKRRFGTSLPALIFARFLKENISLVIIY